MDVINPEIRDLKEKYQELKTSLARVEGQVELLKITTKETARQTIWQFIIFAATIAAILIGGIRYQTDVLRKEMDFRFDAQRSETGARFGIMEKRFEAMEKRMDQMEKNLLSRFEDLKQEVRASRK
jgi:hypothetical protein